MTQVLKPGTVIADRFRVVRFLGAGAMANVYEAAQDADPKTVALKIMSDELSTDPSFVRRFEREAKAASVVRHPNSVRIVAYGVSGAKSYIAMELLKGESLGAELDRSGPFKQRRAARIIAEVCEALAVAHEIGIVHRDLKPENVMVIPDASAPEGERVKVLDFGIAKMLEAGGTNLEPVEGGEEDIEPEPSTQLTRAGTILGTPAYMSPEQCALKPLDGRSDLYTCGILLYQLITGGVPFEGDSPLHTAALHIHEPPPPPSTYAPHVDARLEALIVKTLSKDPSERHQTARELGAALRVLAKDLPNERALKGRPPSLRPSSRPAPMSTDDLRAVSSPRPLPPTPRPAAGAPASPNAPPRLASSPGARDSMTGVAMPPSGPFELAPPSSNGPRAGVFDASSLLDRPPSTVSGLGPTLSSSEAESVEEVAPTPPVDELDTPEHGSEPPSSDEQATRVREPVAPESVPVPTLSPGIGHPSFAPTRPTVRSRLETSPGIGGSGPPRAIKETLRSSDFKPSPSSITPVRIAMADEPSVSDGERPPLRVDVATGGPSRSALKNLVSTIPIPSTSPYLMNPPPPGAPPQNEPMTTPARPMAQTLPMRTLPMISKTPFKPTPAAQPSSLTGSRGMILGFLLGMVVMAIAALVYWLAFRR